MKAKSPPPTGLQSAATLGELAEMFRGERKALGLTQTQVAERAGCRRQTIADIEQGRNVGSLLLLKAIGAISKRVQLCARQGLDLENVRSILGPDWDD